MKDHLSQLVQDALAEMQTSGVLPNDIHIPPIKIENTKDKSHGDFACNIAMMLAKPAGQKPRDIASSVIAALQPSEHILKMEIAGPGFINFFLNQDAATSIIKTVLSEAETFGCNNSGGGKKAQVEFVSANPTGPLHVGHGRGAAVGDSLSRLLCANGWKVTREFYYNDAGQQINNLALSVQARINNINPGSDSWPKDGYQGEYIVDIAKAYMAGESASATDKQISGAKDPDNLEAIRDFAVAYLRHEQDLDLKAFDVDFDIFYLESSLYTDGKVEEAVSCLIKSGYTYEKDGALWLKTTEFGDDKDRVMRKTDGTYTYFIPDVAYHLNKWERGFETVINEQGADHHSTVTRVRAGLQAASKHLQLNIPVGWPDYVLHQMVMVVRGGEEVKLSKRAGSYLTLRDLIDEVGKDATRYFLAARAPSSQLTFDIDLAISQSNDNPVYYLQYAHARVCSMFRKLESQGQKWSTENLGNLNALDNDHEKALMKRLSMYPETISSAGRELAPHLLANYLQDLAREFHAWYNEHKILVDNDDLRNARLALSVAVKQVLANGLQLLGLSAPESM